ncbi:TIGR03086 family metal-binding protein [Streptomonospora wellingtoniae]|uniref:TIGR03086 family metal-binding protein n=1 Tax=Streptomonospora wellingtoniae TaxID=3075544 RepID=A0ABU2KWW3_9ACTN|nr:TIGR03086 family metal-binding protein [Streptomonospora sp. DSM 45055]MDT0303735.1 TIGR03086 family metal-binding protein [Streptomonospora sp. DSM 45055]
MTPQPPHDPRAVFSRALDQAQQQIAALSGGELDAPTPCADYDVRALLGHMVAVLHKLARIGTGGDAGDLPDVVEGVADDGWVGAFAGARAETERVWGDAPLDHPVTLPWATLPGHAALDAYTHEFTVHSWDLAHATGRRAALDPDLAVRALEAFPKFAPPEARSGHGPFGPVVSVPRNADVYTRLAAYLGRRP